MFQKFFFFFKKITPFPNLRSYSVVTLLHNVIESIELIKFLSGNNITENCVKLQIPTPIFGVYTGGYILTWLLNSVIILYTVNKQRS